MNNQKEILKKSLILPKTKFPIDNFGHLLVEKNIRDFWTEKEIYRKNLEKNKEKESFILHSGPTYANGKIHCGHVLNYVLKDIIVRFFAKNNYAPFVLGWDAHGLPIEHKVLQKKKTHGLELRNLCKKFSEEQLNVQREQLKKLGLFTDYEDYYSTDKKIYEAEQIRAFGKMVERGLVYRGLRPIHWSWTHETALAENEIEYFDKSDKSIFFKVFVSNSFSLFNNENVYFLAWTTQPWTIPGNKLIAVRGKSSYSLIKIKNDFLIILSKKINLVEEFFKDSSQILDTFSGENLRGIFYKNPYYELESRVVVDDNLVNEEEGTGIVHIAPAFGSEDFFLAKRENIDVDSLLTANGLFTEDSGEIFFGKHFLEVNDIILKDLKERNLLVKEKEIIHSYPHDWRDKSPLIYRLTEQWFIDLKKIKKETIDSIKKVKWYPGWTKEKMEKSINSRQDWCISRQRIWGVPIPVLYDDNKPILNNEIINFIANTIENNGSDCWFNENILSSLKEKFPKIVGLNTKLGKDIMDVWLDSGVSHWCILNKKKY